MRPTPTSAEDDILFETGDRRADVTWAGKGMAR